MTTILVEIVNLELLIEPCIQMDEFCIQMRQSSYVCSCQLIRFMLFQVASALAEMN